MPLAAVCIILLLLKLADVPPVGSWEWWWIALPFGLLFFWWEIASKWVGWDKKVAEKRMKEDERIAAETKRKNRGF